MIYQIHVLKYIIIMGHMNKCSDVHCISFKAENKLDAKKRCMLGPIRHTFLCCEHESIVLIKVNHNPLVHV